MNAATRIVVSGRAFEVAGQAGATWAVLQYVLGLRELGHDVWLVEQVAGLEPATVRTFEAVTAEFDLGDRAALILGEGPETVGVPFQKVREACASADALLNISGVLERPDLLDCFAVRGYVDLDPAFNQLWHASGIDRGFGRHSAHFTLGTAIGGGDCQVPTCGVSWQPTLPPVVLAHWPAAPPRAAGPVTTLANWRSYGSIESGGAFYGQKAHSLRQLLEVPRRSADRFELALAIHPDESTDLASLDAHGWQLVDPALVAGTPQAYRTFIGSSKAELGVAKAGYVAARCGWFSDRSACYLASARPVLAQDTGLAEALPVGRGLLTFVDEDGVLEALETLATDYETHAAAARELAEEHLDSRIVLGALLDRMGGVARTPAGAAPVAQAMS